VRNKLIKGRVNLGMDRDSDSATGTESEPICESMTATAPLNHIVCGQVESTTRHRDIPARIYQHEAAVVIEGIRSPG
jgi:hypothetical protein